MTQTITRAKVTSSDILIEGATLPWFDLLHLKHKICKKWLNMKMKCDPTVLLHSSKCWHQWAWFPPPPCHHVWNTLLPCPGTHPPQQGRLWAPQWSSCARLSSSGQDPWRRPLHKLSHKTPWWCWWSLHRCSQHHQTPQCNGSNFCQRLKNMSIVLCLKMKICIYFYLPRVAATRR